MLTGKSKVLIRERESSCFIRVSLYNERKNSSQKLRMRRKPEYLRIYEKWIERKIEEELI